MWEDTSLDILVHNWQRYTIIQVHGDENYLCGASLHKSYGVPFVSKFITDGNLENTGDL